MPLKLTDEKKPEDKISTSTSLAVPRDASNCSFFPNCSSNCILRSN